MIFGDNDFDAVGLLGILPQHLPDKKSLGLILSEFKPKQGTTVDGSEIPNNPHLGWLNRKKIMGQTTQKSAGIPRHPTSTSRKAKFFGSRQS